MRASYLFFTLFILTGLVLLFTDTPESTFPPIVATLMGQNPENNTWYANLRLWDFSAGEGNSTTGGILKTVGQYLVVGGATAIGIITRASSEYMIFGGLAVTMGMWFQHIWYALLISNEQLNMIYPFNLFLYGILTFVYWFAVLEWLRGKA